MRVDAARFVPAIFDFPEEEARRTCWGRFLELAANRARLITMVRLARGDRIRVSFDLPQGNLQGLEAKVGRVRRDADGYFVGELRFPSGTQRQLLGRALARIFSASA